MRIIGGKFKGKKLFLPNDKKTRPLKDMVKESIFNLLDHSNKFNGESLTGKEISFQPFLKTELKNRVSRYKTKKFVVTLSKSIPGFIYKIETFIKDLEDPDDKVKETLMFQGLRTNKELRESYKKRKDNS